MAIMLMILAIIVGTMLLIACDDVRQFRRGHGDPDRRLRRAGDGACRFSLEVEPAYARKSQHVPRRASRDTRKTRRK